MPYNNNFKKKMKFSSILTHPNPLPQTADLGIHSAVHSAATAWPLQPEWYNASVFLGHINEG